jgi:hypothetical protein
MAVITQLYFQIVKEINYMFGPFSWWAIIRLKLECTQQEVPNKLLISTSIGSHNGDDATKMLSSICLLLLHRLPFTPILFSIFLSNRVSESSSYIRYDQSIYPSFCLLCV